MRVLLNLLPVATGGGHQNAANLWRAVSRFGRDDEWLCVCRPGRGYEALATEAWQAVEPMEPGSYARRIWLENRTLPALASRWGADVLFTPMGAGPLRADVPTVLGWHDSTAGYPESPFWSRITPSQRLWIRLRERYARRAARNARRICVQTETMRGRLSSRWGLDPDRFAVVSNGPSDFLADEPPAPEHRDPGRPWRVLVIGDPKPTKNLEIVPEVGARLHDLGAGAGELALTLESDRGPFLRGFRRSLARHGEPIPIRRIGVVPHERLGALYRGADAVFLPSLLESFSATYVEAMHFGVPLVTSHYDFATEICGTGAEYVDPLDAEDCARGLLRVLTDLDRRAALRRAGFERVKDFPDWEERFRLYRAACASAVGVTS